MAITVLHQGMEGTLVMEDRESKDRKSQLKNKTYKHKKEPSGNVRTEIRLINGLNDRMELMEKRVNEIEERSTWRVTEK